MEPNCGSSGVSRQWIYNVNLCPSSDIEQNMYQFGVSWKLICVFAFMFQAQGGIWSFCNEEVDVHVYI